MGETQEVVVDEAELQHFIMTNSLDERASEALHAAAPAVQATVIKRGDLSDCRNASAAVLGRLRDARMSVNLNARSAEAGISQPNVDVEGFIAAGNLDERAAESLRICSPKVQQVVITRGDLSDCRAPSSVVMSRIKDAQKGAHMSTASGPVDPEALETFIMENALDERATEDLRTSSAAVQNAVISMKLPADARNPSAIILGRIRDAKKNPPKVESGGGRTGGGGGGEEQMMVMMTGMMGMVQSMMGSMAQASQGGATQQFLTNTTNCKWCQQGECWTHQQGGQQAQQIQNAGFGIDVESFIGSNGLDQNAAQMLRSCAPDVQQTVMASGSLEAVRNPSAVMLARIKVAQMKKNVTGSLVNEQQQMQMQQQQQMQAEMLERQMHEQQMQMTMQQQDQQMQAQPQAVEVTPQELYQFIVMNGLDERASEALQGCPPALQRMVMDKGDLTTSRNASGSCMGRIRDARASVVVAPAGGQAAGMGAGQAGGGMMDMMRNMMGMMEAMGGGGMGAGAGAGARGKAPLQGKPPGPGAGTTWDGSMGTGAVAPGLEDFITENGIDQRAAQQLLDCTVEVQQMIMQQGSLRDARNPSAALGGRIRAAGKGQVANMKKRDGPY